LLRITFPGIGWKFSVKRGSSIPPRKGFWNGKDGLRHKSQQQEVDMLMDNVIAGIAIGVFSFVLVIVAKLAAIAVHLILKDRARWQSR
jgi:hypothetical protein